MPRNNVIANCQTQPDAKRFGRIERFKDMRELGSRYPGAAVAESNFQPLCGIAPGRYDEPARLVALHLRR